jgi:large subunit ribosomal protein L6
VSRIGKKAITIPSGIKVNVEDNRVSVQGPKGKLTQVITAGISVAVEKGNVLVTRSDDERGTRAKHGLIRALIQNMIVGTSQGFERSLDINGVGYRAEIKGRSVVLYLGFSHPVEYQIPQGVEVVVEKQTRLIVRGADKEAVGKTAAKIRSFRIPDPYKAKGVTYVGEVIRRKAGKKAIS